ncbi:UNVERIFIED_CONTAM: hypothetical protein Sradi_1765000 [Sesamum radiatum]|uniref:DDE Tnp4 domain-containing protein n=1 Tax=Sesamum radiatum TaxID=300843 RepID=A0AAW2TTQ2_SESRA
MHLTIPEQVQHLSQIIDISDVKCLDNLRMARNAFGRLCQLLKTAGGLRATRHVTVIEQVAIFLSVIAHHKKNWYWHGYRTISKHFHSVLKAVLRLMSLLARPLPVGDECQDSRWQWFKGCLGALDGAHVEVRVPDSDKGRYRNRKGQVSVNVLGVCNIEGKFIYALSGWEESAADGRVLRDAVHRPAGIKVPTGSYYLCDNGYGNVEGFLTPYCGVRYHLRGAGGPQSPRELFNLRHASARNVIERTFGLLKTCWGILRSLSYYPIRVQNEIIIACCLLHNFVRMEMPDGPLELEVPECR